MTTKRKPASGANAQPAEIYQHPRASNLQGSTSLYTQPIDLWERRSHGGRRIRTMPLSLSLVGTHFRNLESRLTQFTKTSMHDCPADDPLGCDCRRVRHGYPPVQCQLCGEYPRCLAQRELIGRSTETYGRREILVPDCCELVIEEVFLVAGVTPIEGKESAA